MSNIQEQKARKNREEIAWRIEEAEYRMKEENARRKKVQESRPGTLPIITAVSL
jgi:hypothetical protein